MSKYRQHTTEQIYQSRINFLAVQDNKYQEVITKQAEKIQEMAAVMDHAAVIDENQSNKDEEIMSRLKTENQVGLSIIKLIVLNNVNLLRDYENF